MGGGGGTRGPEILVMMAKKKTNIYMYMNYKAINVYYYNVVFICLIGFGDKCNSYAGVEPTNLATSNAIPTQELSPQTWLLAMQFLHRS